MLSYGISVTTLEEVFLRVGHGAVEDEEEDVNLKQELQRRVSLRRDSKLDPSAIFEEAQKYAEERKHDVTEDRSIVGLKPEEDIGYQIELESEQGWFNLFSIHFGALFIKRIIQTRRSFISFIVEIFIPILLIFSGLGLATIQFFIDSDQRLMTVTLFPTQQRAIYNSDGFNTGTLSTNADNIINKFND